MRQRTAYWQAITTRPFAIVYWAMTGVEALALVAVWIWGSAEQRVIGSYVVFAVVVVQITLGYVFAERVARRRRSREEARRRNHLPPA